jgi:hypothetical protein
LWFHPLQCTICNVCITSKWPFDIRSHTAIKTTYCTLYGWNHKVYLTHMSWVMTFCLKKKSCYSCIVLIYFPNSLAMKVSSQWLFVNFINNSNTYNTLHSSLASRTLLHLYSNIFSTQLHTFKRLPYVCFKKWFWIES